MLPMLRALGEPFDLDCSVLLLLLLPPPSPPPLLLLSSAVVTLDAACGGMGEKCECKERDRERA